MAHPWVECWTFEPNEVQTVRRQDGSAVLRRMSTSPAGWPDVSARDAVRYDDECARLFAAAPDMVRVLLAIEWSAGDGGCECPSCHSYGGATLEHDANCALDAALRKAGVR